MSTYGTPYKYSERIGNAAEWNDACDAGDGVECADCSWRGHVNDVKPIRHYWERVDEDDDNEPAGECPACGALANFVTED